MYYKCDAIIGTADAAATDVFIADFLQSVHIKDAIIVVIVSVIALGLLILGYFARRLRAKAERERIQTQTASVRR